MAIWAGGHSATIYDFAQRASVLRGAATRGARFALAPAVAVTRSAKPASGCASGWYHEAALQDADPARKP